MKLLVLVILVVSSLILTIIFSRKGRIFSPRTQENNLNICDCSLKKFGISPSKNFFNQSFSCILLFKTRKKCERKHSYVFLLFIAFQLSFLHSHSSIWVPSYLKILCVYVMQWIKSIYQNLRGPGEDKLGFWLFLVQKQKRYHEKERVRMEGGWTHCNRLCTVRRDTYHVFGLKKGCRGKMANVL